jgi:hypothetical protein
MAASFELWQGVAAALSDTYDVEDFPAQKADEVLMVQRLDFSQNDFFDLSDSDLITLIEGPFLDSFWAG